MIEPSKMLENSIRCIHKAFSYANTHYWLSFGALWGLVKNNGVIPDNDLDICVFYGADYKRIEKALGSMGYKMHHAMVDDTNHNNALHCGFDHDRYPHLCLSFWYQAHGKRWYCHDSHAEVTGVGVPSDYHFRGIPAHDIDNLNNYRLVEWPGINQMYKIRVPRFPGAMCFRYAYPDWAYQKQRYNIVRNKVQNDKMMSYHKGGAISEHAVCVKSMNDWGNVGDIEKQLIESKKIWELKLKSNK